MFVTKIRGGTNGAGPWPDNPIHVPKVAANSESLNVSNGRSQYVPFYRLYQNFIFFRAFPAVSLTAPHFTRSFIEKELQAYIAGGFQ